MFLEDQGERAAARYAGGIERQNGLPCPSGIAQCREKLLEAGPVVVLAGLHRVGEFAKTGLELNACGNTMQAQKVTLNDLLPGFIEADRGGVVRIAELQSMGYVYLRP